MNNTIRTIYRHLLNGIAEGRLLPGQTLPTEKALAEEFGTTRMNAGRALALLKKNGLAKSRKRAGTILSDSLPGELINGLLNESSRVIHVLYSSTPHHVHWSSMSFNALESVVKKKGYSVRYQHIPTGSERNEFRRIIDQASQEEVAALVIFPDSEDADFLNGNNDLLVNVPIPVFLLNRGNDTRRLDFVSSVTLDCLADGIYLGSLLRKNNFDRFICLGIFDDVSYWQTQRVSGLELGLKEKDNGRFVLEKYMPTPEDCEKTACMIRDDAVKRKTVFIGLNYYFASHFMDYWNGVGLKPGADYDLVAFDDNPLYRPYDITGLMVPVQELGEIFGNMICGESWYWRYPVRISVRLSSKLIERSSCRKLEINHSNYI